MLDDEVKKEISKCSRCALCLQNCPIYEIKKDENNTSRGLICKLSGYERGELNIKEIKKDLKICLNCTKCKTNCPSKINTSYVFALKNANFSPSKISQKFLLILKLLPVKIIYLFNFFKFVKIKKHNSDIAYFKGCFAKSQHKKTFLDDFSTPDFSCCALPYLACGDLKNYNKAKEKNIELIKKFKTVVFDCASCKNAVLDYPELNEEEKKKLVFFDELLKNKKLKLKDNSKYKNKVVTFHKPCHMDKSDFLNIENLLKSIEDIKYKQLENYDSCCGFGGSYFLFHPVVALKIALKKAKNIKKTTPDLILTACPSCTMGLRVNQIISFNFKKTLELRDFINNELITD